MEPRQPESKQTALWFEGTELLKGTIFYGLDWTILSTKRPWTRKPCRLDMGPSSNTSKTGERSSHVLHAHLHTHIYIYIYTRLNGMYVCLCSHLCTQTNMLEKEEQNKTSVKANLTFFSAWKGSTWTHSHPKIHAFRETSVLLILNLQRSILSQRPESI